MSLFVEPYRIIPVIGDYAVARARIPPPGHICYGCGNYNPFQPCVGFCYREILAKWKAEREEKGSIKTL